MSTTFFTSVAERFYARRLWLLGTSLLGAAVLAAGLSVAPPHLASLVGTLAGPAIAVPWALLCACVWFHPQLGKLQPQSKLIGRLPPLLQTGVRWYAAIVLELLLVCGAVVWPVLSVAWL